MSESQAVRPPPKAFETNPPARLARLDPLAAGPRRYSAATPPAKLQRKPYNLTQGLKSWGVGAVEGKAAVAHNVTIRQQNLCPRPVEIRARVF